MRLLACLLDHSLHDVYSPDLEEEDSVCLNRVIMHGKVAIDDLVLAASASDAVFFMHHFFVLFRKSTVRLLCSGTWQGFMFTL